MAATATVTKKPRKVRKIYSPKKRAAILAEAKAKGLTGKDVAKKYGISMVTYYLWRKKAGGEAGNGRGKRAAATTSRNGSTGDMRKVIKERVRMLAPTILREEVLEYLAESLERKGARGGKRR